MNIAIIGATTGIGKEALQQALQQGHKVKAMSPSANNLVQHYNLTAISGTATNLDIMKQVLQNTDGALICVGTKQKKNTTLFSEMAKAIITAAQQINYDKPIIVVSGFGVGQSYKYASFFVKTIIKLFLKDQFIDKERMEEMFEQSDLQWEMVQTSMLTNGIISQQYKTYTTLTNDTKVSKISRADVADYMLKELIEKRNLKQKVVLSGN